jgi:hypothetical protein
MGRQECHRTELAHIEKGLRASSLAGGEDNLHRKEHPMLDLVMLAIGLGFFALTVGYAFACDRL